MRVTDVYAIRDSEQDSIKRNEINSAIKVLEDAFEACLNGAKAALISGENKTALDLEKVKEAMKLFRNLGMEIPEEIDDEAAKLFILKFGKEMIF